MRLQSNIASLFLLFFVVYNGLECLYWYDDEDVLRRNPCGTEEIYVPESASPIFLDE